MDRGQAIARWMHSQVETLEAPPGLKSLPGRLELERLGNGLTVCLLENPQAPVVTSALFYRAGTRDALTLFFPYLAARIDWRQWEWLDKEVPILGRRRRAVVADLVGLTRDVEGRYLKVLIHPELPVFLGHAGLLGDGVEPALGGRSVGLPGLDLRPINFRADGDDRVGFGGDLVAVRRLHRTERIRVRLNACGVEADRAGSRARRGRP